jgi:hypothetical protein
MKQKHFESLITGIEEDMVNLCEDNEVMKDEITEYFTTFKNVHFEMEQ